MEFLSNAAAWLSENWQLIVSVLSALLAAASIITKLTPTAKDDEWVLKLTQWLSFLQPKDAGTVKLPGTSPKEPFTRLEDE